jgi:ComF family protein
VGNGQDEQQEDDRGDAAHEQAAAATHQRHPTQRDFGHDKTTRGRAAGGGTQVSRLVRHSLDSKRRVSGSDHSDPDMQRFIDVLLPAQCPACGAEGAAPCAACQRRIGRRLGEPAGLPIGLPSTMPAGLVQLEWCASFGGPARACLHALKYDGERRLAGPLGRLMARRWREVAMGGDVLVPVPVHAARRRDRGFDQAELLADAAGAALRLPVVPALRRAARTTAQHALGRGARAGNVGHAFAVDERWQHAVSGKWMILIDDVVTTGATVAACADCLYAAGARAVSALSLARER